MPYYVVNTATSGRLGQGSRASAGTHIMESATSSTPDPNSIGGMAAQLLWFGGNAKSTLCGRPALRHVEVFTPDEVSCRECKRRWQLATGGSTRSASGDSRFSAKDHERARRSGEAAMRKLGTAPKPVQDKPLAKPVSAADWHSPDGLLIMRTVTPAVRTFKSVSCPEDHWHATPLGAYACVIKNDEALFDLTLKALSGPTS
jgi:hypothetical protein